ncbi:MAG: helix-turn-helix domain-containing protein [Candidatus Caenarcaniphilales bacterium]|nr:helix-turn-helix domain-containing protein [Candidatus Caenarcaniphilales bacterium]
MPKRVSFYYKPEGMLSREDAAEYLGLSKAMLYWLQKRGILAGERIPGAGRVTYYSQDALLKFKSEREDYVGGRIREVYRDPVLRVFFSECGKKGRGKKKNFELSPDRVSEIKRKAAKARWEKNKKKSGHQTELDRSLDISK